MCAKVFVLVCLCVVFEAYGQGEPCTKDGSSGVCVVIRDCPAAIQDIKKKKNPQICGFSGVDPIVCCVSSSQGPSTWAPPVATTPKKPGTTTGTYVPQTYDYEYNDDRTDDRKDSDNNEGKATCEPLSANLTAPKTGQKAWDKCIEYQEKLIYPCEKGVALAGGLVRGRHCNHNADELIIGGVDAARGEFPHMVLLGYGASPQTASWLCGGTLISERYVMTAGHCASSREDGPVSFVRISALKRTDLDLSQIYKVKTIKKHPQYKSPSKYNDIALLETETEMKLSRYAVPACLHTGDAVADEKASASGWGDTQYRGQNADNLQKVILTKFTDQECSEKYSNNRHMKQGVDRTTQVCYGDRNMSKDTCQGDSGGPLQIKNKKIHCMYTVVGVTSFGKACGWVGEPGIYTRVAHFVNWIEKEVWP